MLATGPLLGFYIGFWIDGLAGTGYVRFIMLFLGFIAGVRSVLRVLKEETPHRLSFPEQFVPGAPSEELANPPDETASAASSTYAGDFCEKFEVGGEIIGLMHYSRRKTGYGGTPASVSAEPEVSGQSAGEHVKNCAENSNPAAPSASSVRLNAFALPVIVSVGLWTAIVASSAVALAGQREIGVGILASGLWNLLNFLALWLVFKLVFSNNPYRIFFTLPVVCIKIPLLYFLVVELFRLNLFDRLGLTLGLLALPAVFLFLALLNGRA